MESKTKERLKRLLVIVIGIALMADTWYLAFTLHEFHLTRSLAGPLLIFGGLAEILCPPISKEEYIAEHGEEPRNYWCMTSSDYKMIGALGVIAGAIYALVISGN